MTAKIFRYFSVISQVFFYNKSSFCAIDTLMQKFSTKPTAKTHSMKKISVVKGWLDIVEEMSNAAANKELHKCIRAYFVHFMQTYEN